MERRIPVGSNGERVELEARRDLAQYGSVLMNQPYHLYCFDAVSRFLRELEVTRTVHSLYTNGTYQPGFVTVSYRSSPRNRLSLDSGGITTAYVDPSGYEL